MHSIWTYTRGSFIKFNTKITIIVRVFFYKNRLFIIEFPIMYS